MSDTDRSFPRWWSHASIKRYGWRRVYAQSPRIWRWGLHAELYVLLSFNLGIWLCKDEEGERMLSLGFALFEIQLRSVPFITKRRARELQDEFARRHGALIADEAELFLREHS